MSRKLDIDEAVARYIDPEIVPNREHWLVLRKYSRRTVRAWLRELPSMTDDRLREEFRPVIIGRFHVMIEDRPDIGKALRHLDTPAPISPEALDAYLSAHPHALSGNAEAHLCGKHQAYMTDISRLRETLNLLLDPEIDVLRRVDCALDGPYKLPGFGNSTVTTIIECWNDGKEESHGPTCSKWTGHTERAFAKLGIPFRDPTPAKTYAHIWERQRQLLSEYRVLHDLSDIDLFMFFVDPRGLNMGQVE